MKHIVSITLFLVITIISYSQSENQIWQLSEGIEMDLNSFPPSLTKQNNFRQTYLDRINFPVVAVATISDSSGNLLFYSDGYTAFNNNHEVMEHGRNLQADLQIEQSVLIVPKPRDNNKFYLFTSGKSPASIFAQPNVDFASVLTYSIVDMSLNDGKGDIIEHQKNQRIQIGITHGLAAAKGNCENVWLIVKSFCDITVYEITADGIREAGVSTSSLCSGVFSTSTLKISPDNSKICVVNNIFHLVLKDFIELFDFNNNTGEVKPLVALKTSINEDYYAGISFSPKGNYLYAYFFNSLTSNTLVRYDLSSNDPNQIIASGWIIARPQTYIRDLQIGGDNVIYAQNRSYLGAITNPDQISSKYIDSLVDYPDEERVRSNFQNLVVVPTKSKLLDTNLPSLDTSFCSGESVLIDLNSYSEFDITWQDGSQSSQYSIDEAGTYSVLIEDQGCAVSDTFLVEEKENCECNLFIPNAFSPNEDGINDVFQISSNCEVSNFSLSVYSNWGELLFESSSISTSWDGSMGKRKLQPGVYVYQISYNLNDESHPRFEKGSITLIH